MAANFLGDQQTDALRTLDLCEQALAFACYSACDVKGSLRDGGSFLCKFFSAGKEHEEDLMEQLEMHFSLCISSNQKLVERNLVSNTCLH